MTYASGGLIQATDYNTLVGSNSTTASTLNYVWDVGNGVFGYGQGAISVVTSAGTVTATQWSTMLNALNRTLQHQSGAGATLGPVNYTAGQTITYFANVNTAITSTIQTNAALFTAQGSTTTGTNDATNPTAAATSALSYFRDTNVTFSSADAARYFFNAGGQINFVCSAVDNNGSSRSATLRDMVNQVGGLNAFRNTTNGGRTGTDGTIVTNNTSFGYRNMVFNSATTIVNNDVAGVYSAHDVQLQVFTGSNNTTNGANGDQVVFRLFISAAADDAAGGDINLTLNVRADVVFPETTYLSSSPWGTPTITFDSA
jgi:hypothetical protein